MVARNMYKYVVMHVSICKYIYMYVYFELDTFLHVMMCVYKDIIDIQDTSIPVV